MSLVDEEEPWYSSPWFIALCIIVVLAIFLGPVIAYFLVTRRRRVGDRR